MTNYPAFFSYSHGDNERWGGYISDLHAMLSRQVAGNLGVKGIVAAEDCFFDQVAFRGKTGDIDKLLRENVQKSAALVIVLGEGYVRSEYCCRELAFFAEKHQYAYNLYHNRVWIVEPEPLSEPSRTRFHQQLEKANAAGLRNARRQLFYDTTHKQRVVLTNGTSTNQLVSRDYVEPIAREVSQLFLSDAPPAVSVTATHGSVDVIVGVATPDLRAACVELRAALGNGITVEQLTMEDLTNTDEVLRNKLANARLVVLPVSNAKVIAPMLPGGHLGRQFEMMARVGDRLEVWQPPESGLYEPETSPANIELIRKLTDRAPERLSARAEAEQIMRLLTLRSNHVAGGGESVLILVEKGPEGDDSWELLSVEVSRQWKDLAPAKLKGAWPITYGLNLPELRKSSTLVDGDAVIVFSDESDDLTTKKCEMIASYMRRWQAVRIPVPPGLIAQSSDAARVSAVESWPKANYKKRDGGIPPTPTYDFEPGSSDNLQRFFRRIEKLREAGK